jgi:Ca-activated chloride channel family protein
VSRAVSRAVMPALAAWLLTVPSVPALHAGAGQFRTRTDLVSVYVTVTDKVGHLITDLKEEDFEVRDEGKPQKLTVFSNAVQPITIVVMLDRSGSMEDNFPLVQAAAERFIDQLGPEDKARIGNFSRQIIISPPDFTTERETLRSILRHDMQDVGPSPVWTAVDRSITALAKQDGRRVILLFTDGHDSPQAGQIATSLKDVARRAEVDEIMIYSIGLADTDLTMSAYALHTQLGQLGTGDSAKRKLIKPDPGLKKLADQSGGSYFELTWDDDLPAVFTRVADELHHQYALAFPPAKLDGSVHKLEVKVKRDGLVVRARKSYVAEQR